MEKSIGIYAQEIFLNRGTFYKKKFSPSSHLTNIIKYVNFYIKFTVRPFVNKMKKGLLYCTCNFIGI